MKSKMTRLVSYALAVALLAVLPAIAGEKKKETSESSAGAHHANGTITGWNEATKMITVKSSKGEKSFTWNDATKVQGTPKVGEHVSVEYAKNKEGVVTVTQIHVGKHTSTDTAKK